MFMFLNYPSFAVIEIIWEKRQNIYIYFNIKKLLRWRRGYKYFTVIKTAYTCKMNYLGEHWCIDLPSLFLDVIRQNHDREIRAGGGVEKLCGCMAWFQSVWLHAAGEQKNRFTFLDQQGHLFEAVFGTNLYNVERF